MKLIQKCKLFHWPVGPESLSWKHFFTKEYIMHRSRLPDVYYNLWYDPRCIVLLRRTKPTGSHKTTELQGHHLTSQISGIADDEFPCGQWHDTHCRSNWGASPTVWQLTGTRQHILYCFLYPAFSFYEETQEI